MSDVRKAYKQNNNGTVAITVPKDIRDDLGIEEGSNVIFRKDGDRYTLDCVD